MFGVHKYVLGLDQRPDPPVKPIDGRSTVHQIGFQGVSLANSFFLLDRRPPSHRPLKRGSNRGAGIGDPVDWFARCPDLHGKMHSPESRGFIEHV